MRHEAPHTSSTHSEELRATIAAIVWSRALYDPHGFDCADAILALIPSWRPIESAPKGSGEILIGFDPRLKSTPVRMMIKTHGHWFCVCGNPLSPTHWHPVPDPPETRLTPLVESLTPKHETE